MLLGPAGSGKTHRCLSEIRRELSRSPEGRPLIFLAPRQATFQLERQLLDDPELAGCSRLRILSFERLARLVFDSCGVPAPKLLGAEGRVMVLRALLGSLHSRLSIFRASARRLGFAEEAGDQIREFQQHGLAPARLREIASSAFAGPSRDKLFDLALLFEAYQRWLHENTLQDEECLLSLAADLLKQHPGRLRPEATWFDGFAQLTPQERSLLLALLRESDRALLAFCLGAPSTDRFSPWQTVTRTFELCRAELTTAFGKQAVHVENIAFDPAKSRFASAPALAHLERAWAGGSVFPGESDQIRLIECPDPEVEVIECARAIVRFVRDGGRYRETAVLVRHFDNDFPHLLRRVFARYRIPFFLDHRASVAHHPLAELTRGALRMIVFKWKHQDCFCVFKSGLLEIRTEMLDAMENLVLEHGWDGAAWRNGFPVRKDAQIGPEIDQHRRKLIEPFVRLESALGEQPSGSELAAGLRQLWADCRAEKQLEDWSVETGEPVHTTIWDQMTAWLDNLQLAFSERRMPLRDWAAIVEAGLSGLTVGVIPPVLDQVLVGTVDRSRNPDLKQIFVLGLNEGIFPAIPPHRPLLTEQDRTRLLDHGIELANLPEQQIALEQFYGYIACTRARERLILSWSLSSFDGTSLNASRFVGQVSALFPSLKPSLGFKPRSLEEAEHPCELSGIAVLPESLKEFARSLPAPDQCEALDPEIARRLYGPELKVSVSALERYAMCPFRFFMEQGLKAKEREEFSLDVRQQGSFQHEVLARYHSAVRGQKKRWRDLSPAQARALIGKIADELMPSFAGGVLEANEQNRFTGENYKASLQDFIEVVTEWFQFNDFDPVEVEMPFGQDDGGLPGWPVEIPGFGRLILGGRIDRVDIARGDGASLCAVIDYKSGRDAPDRTLMHHGVQQQLPAYLLALCRIPGARAKFGLTGLTPAGSFYVPLTPRHESENTRNEALRDPGVARKIVHQHLGVFSHAHIASFDKSYQAGGSAQFKFSLKDDLQPRSSGFSALSPEDFAAVLARLEENLLRFGREIFEGNIAIRPFKKAGKTGCDTCKHSSACRFDPWVQEFNNLRKPGKEESD